jgi:uncharacterized damage-inducible protein DinB
MSHRKDEIIDYLDKIRSRTVRVAECVPADRIDWSAGHGSMSCADLLRHIAVCSRWLFVETCLGGQNRYTSHGPELGGDKASILTLLSDCHQDSLAKLRALDEARFESKVKTPAGFEMPMWKFLRAMTEHEAHHRGQLYFMLRLMGVETPPIFGLTSEQVRDAADRAV